MHLTAYAIKSIMGPGDKTGSNRFYQTFVPRAERIWAEYLASLAKEEQTK